MARSASRGLLRCASGAATVEAALTFPVLAALAATAVQLGALELASLVTAHAANEAARSAAVILADDPRFYGGEPVGHTGGERLREIASGAKWPLRAVSAAPDVRVSFDRRTYAQGDPVRLTLDFQFPCAVALGRWFVCGRHGTFALRETATVAFQGAGYAYP